MAVSHCMGAGKQTCVLWKSSLLTADSSLQSQFSNSLLEIPKTLTRGFLAYIQIQGRQECSYLTASVKSTNPPHVLSLVWTSGVQTHSEDKRQTGRVSLTAAQGTWLELQGVTRLLHPVVCRETSDQVHPAAQMGQREGMGDSILIPLPRPSNKEQVLHLEPKGGKRGSRS